MNFHTCPKENSWSPFCKSSDTRNRRVNSAKNSWDYYRCGLCGAIKIDEYTNVDDVYENEKIRKEYQTLPRGVRLAHHLLGHPLKKIFDRLDFTDYRILDVGCGNGEKLYDFHIRGAQLVCGVELSQEKIDVAKKYMPGGHFFNGLLEKSPFEKQFFDIVISDNVIEHLADPDEFVHQMREYIKPGGKVVLMTPNGRSYTIQNLKEHALNIWPPFHVNLFTAEYFKHHFPDIQFEFKMRSHFFTLRHSLKRAGYSTFIATLKALLLLPFAKEELLVIYS